MLDINVIVHIVAPRRTWWVELIIATDDGDGVKRLRVSLREFIVEASVPHNFSLLAISPKFKSQPVQ